MSVVMNAGDSISAKLAKCYVTVSGRRYNAFNFIKFEAKFTKKKVKVPILGQTGAGNKATGWEGTWSATMHYNTSTYRQMMLDYKNTGQDVYFEIQVSNEDPTSAAGKQTVTFLGCNIDGGILSKFDASSDDPLDEDVDGTFENFEMPDKFELLPGM